MTTRNYLGNTCIHHIGTYPKRSHFVSTQRRESNVNNAYADVMLVPLVTSWPCL